MILKNTLCNKSQPNQHLLEVLLESVYWQANKNSSELFSTGKWMGSHDIVTKIKNLDTVVL